MSNPVDGAVRAGELPPLFYIVNQHIGWLKQYLLGMDETNWRDMQAHAERQLESLSSEIDKIAALRSPATREEIAKALYKRRFRFDGEDTDKFFAMYAENPHGTSELQMSVFTALQDADAILSLPAKQMPLADD